MTTVINGISNELHFCDLFSLQVGLIFLFNLIVGTGALTLPAAFAKTGWLLGLFLIVILAFISYMTVTFLVETMACANAITQWERVERRWPEPDADNVNLKNPIILLATLFAY